MKNLFIIMILLFAFCFAYSQIDELYVIKVENEAEFAELHSRNGVLAQIGSQGLTRVRGQAGFDRQDELESVSLPEAELSNDFKLNEYIVLCFTPRQSLYIRLMDTRPNNTTAQLYPEGNGTVLVEGGETHCIGDRGPYFYADEASGIGRGVLWFYGSTKDTSGRDLTGLDVPASQSGQSWASTPVLDSGRKLSSSDRDGEAFYAHYRYNISR